MATLSFPSTGRLLTLINRTGQVLGVVGTTIGPFGTKTVPLRRIQGHPTHMSKLETLIRNGDVQASVTQDILDANDVSKLDAPLSGEIWLTRQVFTDPVAADVDAIKTSFTAPAADTTYSGAQLDGVVGAGELDYARNIVITGTTGGSEALDGGTAVVYGVDTNGQPIQENFTLGAIGASTSDTATGVQAFAKVTAVLIPADASGTPGAYEVGFGDLLGLIRPLSQGGLLAEFEDNAVPGTPGTIVLSGTSAPNGTYSPDSSPDGSLDFIVYFIAG